MEDKQTKQLTVIDAEGNEVLCQILFTYHSDEFNKDYVIFYPMSSFEDDSEQLELMAASYVEGENGGELSEITTDEEWKMIEDVLEEFENNFYEEEHGHCCCHEDEEDEEEEGCHCCCKHHE